MDETCEGVITKRFEGKIPTNRDERDEWLDPDLENIDGHGRRRYQNMAGNLKRGLLHGNAHSVIGLLCFCLDHALNDRIKPDGVFKTVRESSRWAGARKLLKRVEAINKFRNNYVAHSRKQLTDRKLAENNLRNWLKTIGFLRVVMHSADETKTGS